MTQPTPDKHCPMRFIARQPIFDQHRQIYGYELLSRSGWENRFSADMTSGTQHILDSSFLFGLDVLCHGHKAFINCTQHGLIEGLFTLLPTENTVLEILENVAPDTAVVAACRSLKQAGYPLALDDFIPRRELEPLIALADYIKIDFRAHTQADRARLVRQPSPPAIMLAEKVETQEEFESAVAMGYTLFQGYHFAKPHIMARNEIPTGHLNALRLLSALHQPQFDLTAIERIIKSDASLYYRLLRFLNSAAHGFTSEITSIRHALMLIGELTFRNWASVAVLMETAVDAPLDVVVSALVRARFCELLERFLKVNANELFLAGLLSRIDAILGLPRTVLVEELPLLDSIRRALLDGDNRIADALKISSLYEAGSWQECQSLASRYAIREAELAEIYLAAIRWGEQAVGQVET